MQQIAMLLSPYVRMITGEQVAGGEPFDMAATRLDELFSRAKESREIL